MFVRNKDHSFRKFKMDSIGSISNEDVLVLSDLESLGKINLIDFPQGTYINFKEEVPRANIVSTGNSAIGGAGVKSAQVSILNNNRKIHFHLRQTKFESSEISSNESTEATVKVKSSNVRDSTFSFDDKNDSISFAGNSSIHSSRINMKSGNDSITFAGRSVLSGQNNVTLGAGRDKVSIGKQVRFSNDESSLIIKDFDNNDTLSLGNKNYNLNNIAAGQVDNVALGSDGSVHIHMDLES